MLASASPRRKELLKNLIQDFEVCEAGIDEDAETTLDPYATAERLALLKARCVQQKLPEKLIIGGDTVVAIPLDNGEFTLLSKPVDNDDAVRMLSLLSGNSHLVVTGLALSWPGGEIVCHDVSTVSFRLLSELEVSEYVSSGEPMDKAGAYAIQAGGGSFIKTIEGSRTNVIGLPVELLERMLLKVFPT